MPKQPENNNDLVRVSKKELFHARSRFEQNQLVYDEVQAHLDEIVANQTKLQAMMKRNHRLIKIRGLCDRTVTRVGGFINIILISLSLLLMITSVMKFSIFGQMVFSLAGALMAGCWGIRLFVPSDEKLALSVRRWSQKLDDLTLTREKVDRKLEQSLRSLQAAEAPYLRLLDEYNRNVNPRSGNHWKEMRGIEFEDFLADVFVKLGYKVETTKTTGDQGADLLVSKKGRKIAIQAKGYPNSTVGNKAVQEAHAGKSFYQCQAAAVITNSTYTTSARKLAAKIDCILIDRSQIPDIIKGRLQI